MEPEKKVNHLEEIKKKLYSRNQNLLKKRRENPLHDIKYGVSKEWLEDKAESEGMLKKVKLPPSFFKRLFIFSAAFFVIALGFVAYKFYGGSNTISSQNIDIVILGNSFTAGGEELPLQIEITNNNNVPLELSDLLIEYPKGSKDATNPDFVRIRKSLGKIEAGKTVSDSEKIVLFGEQGTTKDIKVSLEYRVQGSNAIFTKEATHTVNIDSSPVSITIQAPKNIVSNQEITLNIKVVSNTEKVIKDMLLNAEYPPGFTFTSSDPKSILGEDTWDLGDLGPNMQKTISIKGTVTGEDREERSFNFFVGEKNSGDSTALGAVYNSIAHSVTIERPFIEARLLVNSLYQDEFSVPSQTPITAEIRWANNLPTKIDDVQISAHIIGNALDKRSISVFSGFYNSLDDTITWDKNTQTNLSSIQPGETGVFSFSFNSASLMGDSGALMSDPVINIDVSIKGKQPTEGGVLNEINSFEKKTIKINSDLALTSKALHYSGPLQNTGPIPPKAEQKTTYTIVWTATNTANSVSQATVKASLPLYVKYLGVTSPQSENISYNNQTREVTWVAGPVSRGAGFNESSREAAFQVELLPSLSQVGSVPQLLSESVLTGMDNFTKSLITSKRTALNTRLISDTVFKSGDERVVE